MEQDIQKQREELTRLSNAVNGTKLELEALERTAVDKRSEITNLESEIAARVAKTNSLAVDIEFAENSLSDLLNKKQSLLTDFARIEKDTLTAKADHEALTAKAKVDVAEIEAGVSRLVDEKNALSQKYATQLEKLIADILAAKASHEKLQNDIDLANLDLTEVNKHVEFAYTQVEEAQKRFAAIESQIPVKQSVLRKLESECEAAHIRLENTVDATAEAEGQLKVVNEAVESLKTELQTLQKEKFNILEAKKSLQQKEEFIRARFKDAGVEYPE